MFLFLHFVLAEAFSAVPYFDEVEPGLLSFTLRLCSSCCFQQDVRACGKSAQPQRAVLLPDRLLSLM
jgi:hypothetical protein